MSYRIITISREFGSGGRTIGKKVAEKLGIPCYDSELIDWIAKQSGLSSGYIEEEGEQIGRSWFGAALADRSMGMTNQDLLWTVQQNVIREIAEKECCVIVGRCADYILRDRKDVLNVFIHADKEKRAERIVHEYGETNVAPAQRIKEKDKRRAAYYRFYTDLRWGESWNYALCLDSGILGIDRCVDLITQLYE